MDKEFLIYERVIEFMNEHSIECVEDVFQVDSINEDCENLAADLVNIILGE